MKKLLFFCLISGYVAFVYAQESKQGQFSGNYNVVFQTFQKDSLINAAEPDEKIMMNSYANFTYSYQNFKAGGRFEGALNPIPGYDARNNGIGFPNRYVSYTGEKLEATFGSFYEQFGNGLIFRSYEDKTIDFDNALDGVKILARPIHGVYLKAIYGRQRDFFGMDENGKSSLSLGSGILRGADAEVFINELSEIFSQWQTQISLGAGIVSKFQKDNDPSFILPENVSAFSGRLGVSKGNVVLNTEYAYKINDPGADNNYIYKNGQAFLVNATYSQSGLGLYVSAKRIDNMGFRSDRDATLNRLQINFLPAGCKNHIYALPAIYPYSTQPNGEAGIQAEMSYKFKKGTLLGGEKGTLVAINFSRINSIDRQAIDSLTAIGRRGTDGYKSGFFDIGDELYYQDFNIEVNKKISNLKINLSYVNLIYNYDVIKGMTGHGKIYSNIGIADVAWNFAPKQSIRFEAQALFSEQDMKNWATGMIEYSIAPKWFFSISNQYNYGNPDDDLKIHYYSAAIAFAHHSTRMQIGYGKQREGVVCAGGVCRNVPASNGFTLTLTSSF